MQNNQNTIFGNIVLYTTSPDRQQVDISEQMKQLPLETRLILLQQHKTRLEKDLKNYDAPEKIKINSVRRNGCAQDPSKDTLEIHLEITNGFIEILQKKLLNG